MRNKRLVVRWIIIALAAAIPAAVDAATCCVWRITNTPAPVYLCGTIHALSSKDYPLPKAYDEAVRQSNRVLFEIDPSPKSDFGEKFAKAAKYENGDEVGHHLHPKTYMLMFKAIRFVSWDWDKVKHYRPWALAYLGWGLRGYNDIHSAYGVDNHLAYLAWRLHKQTGGLESNDEHIEVLRGMADIDAELLLLDSMVHGPKLEQIGKEARAAWRVGDIGPIAAEEARERQLNIGANIRLLDYRNLRWIKRIEAEIKTGQPVAIVAGTAHFVGPNNVRELLEKRGYKIEQL
jgi:uncharacterized protein YbaP (TraB family)